jgi:hypothetical protein
MIFAAIVTHKSTIVAEPEWKTKPWSQHPGREDSLKRLTDIMADCPELFVLRDQLESSQKLFDYGHLPSNPLLSKVQEVLDALHQWKHRWDSDCNDAYTEEAPPATTPVISDSHGKPIPAWTTIICYKSLSYANALNLYQAALILVLRFLKGIYLALHAHKDLEDIQGKIHSAGLFICRSVDYQLSQTWSDWGAFDILFPLRMAYEAVGRENLVIGTWLKNILYDISAGRSGPWKSAKSVLAL